MSVPPLQDNGSSRNHDGRSRTWTVDHIADFADLPAFEPGERSPVVVALDDWHVNWSDGTLYVFRYDGDDPDERHPDLDHARFNTQEEAHAAAWEAGLLGLWVYEDVAHLYGLPSTLAWVRSAADVMTTECGAEERRVTNARTVEWVRILDRDRDLTPDVWKTIDADSDPQAVFVVSAYGACADDDTVYVEIEYGMVVYGDPDAEEDTELFSNYVYETPAGGADASINDLDAYLTADYTATFKNLGGGDDMADSVWNGCVEDAALFLGTR